MVAAAAILPAAAAQVYAFQRLRTVFVPDYLGDADHDDTDGLRRACAAVAASGGGVLRGDPARPLRIFSVGSTNPNIFGFSGIPIEISDLTLAVDPLQDWSEEKAGARFGKFFAFTGCDVTLRRVRVTGPRVDTSGAAGFGPGRVFAQILGDCTSVVLEDCSINNVLTPLIAAELGPADGKARSRNIRMSNVTAENVMYGFQLTGNGDGSTLAMTVRDVHRAFVMADVTGVNATVTVTDPKHSAQLGYVSAVSVRYVERGSTAAGAAPKINFGWKGTAAGTNRDVTLAFDVAYGASGQGGPLLFIEKTIDGVAPDTADRGHRMDGLDISGRVTGIPAGGAETPCIAMRFDSMFGPGDEWTRIRLHDLVVTDSWIDWTSEPVRDVLQLHDVTCPYGMRLRRNASDRPPRFGRVEVRNVSGRTTHGRVGSGFLGGGAYPLATFKVPDATYALGAAQYGLLCTNELAPAAQVLTLPSASPGAEVRFRSTGAFPMVLDPVFRTTTLDPIAAGSRVIRCASVTGLGPGDAVTVGGEAAVVDRIAAADAFELADPLRLPHPLGAAVVRAQRIAGMPPGTAHRLDPGLGAVARCSVRGVWTLTG